MKHKKSFAEAGDFSKRKRIFQAANTLYEKAAINVKEYKERIETFENDIEKVSFENGLLKEEIKGYSFAKIINNILSRRKFKDMFDKETIHKYGDVIPIPETIDTTSGLKHTDAILDGVVTEFKCISGGKNKLWVHYKDAFSKSEKIIFRLVKKRTRHVFCN